MLIARLDVFRRFGLVLGLSCCVFGCGGEREAAGNESSGEGLQATPAPVEVPSASALDLSTLRARRLFPKRVADQIDLRRQADRVRNAWVSVRAQSYEREGRQVTVMPERSAWGVALGVSELDGRRVFGIVTSSCVLDQGESIAATAIEIGRGRTKEIFRLEGGVSDLESASLRAGIVTEGEGRIERFTAELAPEDKRARVLRTADQPNLVFVFVPMRDRAVARLKPTGRRTIKLRDPRGRLAAISAQLSPVAATTCDAVLDKDAPEAAPITRALGIATSLELVGLMAGGHRTPTFDALWPGFVSAMVARTPEPDGATGWRTVVHRLNASKLQDVDWDEQGRLEIAFRHAHGETDAPLLGVTRQGLSEPQAAAIITAVRAFIESSERPIRVPVIRREGARFCSLFKSVDGADLAAELLASGRVRLDVDLGEHPPHLDGLIAAALLGVEASGADVVTADPDYKRVLSQRAGGQ